MVDIILNKIPMTAIAINLNAIIQLTDDQFYQLCRKNPDVKFERNAAGELLIMSPTGGKTGNHNAEIIADFVIWNRQRKLGYCFDSSTCFKLANGANRSPDVAWIEKERWDALTSPEQTKFPPIVPDFVLELMSPSDGFRETQAKMQEYISNGVKLGWLLDPKTQQVEIYRLGQPVEILNFPSELFGEDVLPGFHLNLQIIWTNS
jgi:Uma2 family endonuclease